MPFQECKYSLYKGVEEKLSHARTEVFMNLRCSRRSHVLGACAAEQLAEERDALLDNCIVRTGLTTNVALADGVRF